MIFFFEIRRLKKIKFKIKIQSTWTNKQTKIKRNDIDFYFFWQTVFNNAIAIIYWSSIFLNYSENAN